MTETPIRYGTADLVVDHSDQEDAFNSPLALLFNSEREF